MLFKKQQNEASQWLKENAPAVTFWMASIILVLFDARVLDVVYRLTENSVLLAVGALFTTALMFFIWKNAFQYTLANKMQTNLSAVGMALSLLASAVFGGMDYFVRGGLKFDTGAEKFTAVDLIFWGIPVLSVVHVIMLLWYWYADPKVASERKRKQADDDHLFTQQEMGHAKELLEKQTGIIADYVAMAQQYGKQAALQQIELLGLDRAAFENIEIPPISRGHGQPSVPSMTMPPVSMTEEQKPDSFYDAMRQGIADAQGVHINQLKDPVTILAGGNGHGRPVNPTKAA